MYKRASHSKYSLVAHLVFCTKYRRKVLTPEISEHIRDIIEQVCCAHNWEVVELETDLDHIHILISYDVTSSIAEIIKVLKQVTTYYVWKEYDLSRVYWNHKVLWARGYFACSIGEGASYNMIKKYIESQG